MCWENDGQMAKWDCLLIGLAPPHPQEAPPPLQPPQPPSPTEDEKMPPYDEETQAIIDGE